MKNTIREIQQKYNNRNTIIEMKKETCCKCLIGQRGSQDRTGELENKTAQFTSQNKREKKYTRGKI